MTLLKDNNYKEINVALLSLEADIKNKITNFDTSVIDKQLVEINSRIDKINAGDNNTSAEINDIRYEIEGINTKIDGNSDKIEDIEQKLSEIFSAENKVTDFNTTTNSGIYYWIDDAANKPANYGVLLVNKYDDGGNGSIWINQIAYSTTNKIYFRQNINSGNWTEWKAVAFEGEGNATLTVNGKTYDGSEAVDAGVQTVENGGTGATTAREAFESLANGLPEGAGPIDTEHIIFQNENRKNWGLYTLSTFWNYIKDKISSVLGLTKDNYGGTAATILDYNRNTPIKVRWGGPGIDSADWYPAFSADGSAIEPINKTNIHVGTADTAGTADTVASAGVSSMWIEGRANAICKTTSAAGGGGWKTLASIKTSSGSIEIGNLSGEDFIRVVYSSDDNVNAGNNNVTQLLYIRRGNIETPHEFIANSVKSPGKMVIPIGAPSQLEDGCIWIER